MGNGNFQPPYKFCMQLGTQGGCIKMRFLEVAALCCYGNNGCFYEAWGLIFIQKRCKKRVKCLFLYLKLNTTLQIGTSTIHSNIIHLHFDTINFPWEWMWTHQWIIHGHFCCRVKQGKRLSEFLQKYTDSGTENTHLAGYNILVFIHVKISVGLPLLFVGAIRERSSKIRYCIILIFCFCNANSNPLNT